MSRWTTPWLVATALTGVAILAGTAAIAAAQMGSTFDPAQLPTIKGHVAQYLPNPHGDVDGVLLDDGTEVHWPPHLSTQIVFAIHPGDAVTIHGLKARAIPMVDAASITNDATNVTVVDTGRWHHHDETQLEVTGKVRAALHNPRGDMDGVLLDTGAVVHLPPPEATRLAAQLAVGQSIVARGDGFAGALGKSIGAREIGPDSAHLVEVSGPRMGMGHWMHEHWGHGPHGGPGMEGPEGGPGAPPPPAQ